MTMLQPGDLLIRKDKEEEFFALSGGFLEVRPDKVIILADACERADEIDLARAEEAKKRAQETMKTAPLSADAAVAEAALRRSIARLKAAERKRAPGTGINTIFLT
jgi:F-type H+-transporting ATPase subunit epsilon